MSGIFLGLGSNKGDRNENLALAISNLGAYSINILKVSSTYFSEPWGFESENIFQNKVIEIESVLDPYSLLNAAKEIERKMGRKESLKGYSDRIIDIDILFYRDEIISSKVLVIPHPLLHKRKFVLEPMAEIAPEFIHPVLGKTVREMIDCHPERSEGSDSDSSLRSE